MSSHMERQAEMAEESQTSPRTQPLSDSVSSSVFVSVSPALLCSTTTTTTTTTTTLCNIASSVSNLAVTEMPAIPNLPPHNSMSQTGLSLPPPPHEILTAPPPPPSHDIHFSPPPRDMPPLSLSSASLRERDVHCCPPKKLRMISTSRTDRGLGKSESFSSCSDTSQDQQETCLEPGGSRRGRQWEERERGSKGAGHLSSVRLAGSIKGMHRLRVRARCGVESAKVDHAKTDHAKTDSSKADCIRATSSAETDRAMVVEGAVKTGPTGINCLKTDCGNLVDSSKSDRKEDLSPSPCHSPFAVVGTHLDEGQRDGEHSKPAGHLDEGQRDGEHSKPAGHLDEGQRDSREHSKPAGHLEGQRDSREYSKPVGHLEGQRDSREHSKPAEHLEGQRDSREHSKPAEHLEGQRDSREHSKPAGHLEGQRDSREYSKPAGHCHDIEVPSSQKCDMELKEYSRLAERCDSDTEQNEKLTKHSDGHKHNDRVGPCSLSQAHKEVRHSGSLSGIRDAVSSSSSSSSPSLSSPSLSTPTVSSSFSSSSVLSLSPPSLPAGVMYEKEDCGPSSSTDGDTDIATYRPECVASLNSIDDDSRTDRTELSVSEQSVTIPGNNSHVSSTEQGGPSSLFANNNNDNTLRGTEQDEPMVLSPGTGILSPPNLNYSDDDDDDDHSDNDGDDNDDDDDDFLMEMESSSDSSSSASESSPRQCSVDSARIFHHRRLAQCATTPSPSPPPSLLQCQPHHRPHSHGQQVTTTRPPDYGVKLDVVADLICAERDGQYRNRHQPSTLTTTVDTGHNSSWTEASTSQAATATTIAIDDLPSVLLVHIFSFLLPATRLSCLSLVCRKWQAATHDPALWRHLDLRNLPRLTDHSLLRLASLSDRVASLVLSDGHSMLLTDEGVSRVLRRCSYLTTIKLNRCFFLSDVAFESVGKYCHSMVYLNLSGCFSVTDRTLLAISQGCPLLQDLGLGQCSHITDVGVTAVAKGCPHLTAFRADQCVKLTDVGVEALATHCPDLQFLHLLSCTLTDHGIAHLAKLTRLQVLDLSNVSELSRGVVERVAGCWPLLETLALSLNRRVDDHCVRSVVSSCPRLKRLSCVACGLSDIGLQHFTKAKQLERLDVAWCADITDAGVSRVVTSCPRLCYLGLMRCPLVTTATVERLMRDHPHIHFSNFELESRRLIGRASASSSPPPPSC